MFFILGNVFYITMLEKTKFLTCFEADFVHMKFAEKLLAIYIPNNFLKLLLSMTFTERG